MFLNILKKWFGIILVLSLSGGFSFGVIGCGPHPSKNDGVEVKKQEVTTSTMSQVDEKGAVDQNGVCLSSCNPPIETVFSFTKTFSITPAGCIASDAKIFDSGNGFTAFVSANCSSQTQLYSLSIGYDGGNPSNPTLLSTACSNISKELYKFTVEKGIDGFLGVAVCKTTSKTYSSYLLTFDTEGKPRSERFLQSIDETKEKIPEYLIAWKENSRVFGLTRNKSFDRYDKDGRQIGGTTYIPEVSYSTGYIGLRSYDDIWSLIEYSNYYGSYCHKVSGVGTLQCTGKSMGSDGIRYPLDKDSILSVKTNGEIGILDFNSSTCTASNKNVVETVLENSLSGIYGAMDLGASYSSLIYTSSTNVLNMAVFDQDSIVSTTPILDYASFKNAHIQSVQNRIYVDVVRDNEAIVTVSDQTLRR